MDSSQKYGYKWTRPDREIFRQVDVGYEGHYSSVEALSASKPIATPDSWARVSTPTSDDIYIWTTQSQPNRWVKSSTGNAVNTYELESTIHALVNGATENYNTLGKIENEFKSQDFSIDEHLENYNNPHRVDRRHLSIENVDNTSDLDKPLSNSIQKALELKLETGEQVKTAMEQLKGDDRLNTGAIKNFSKCSGIIGEMPKIVNNNGMVSVGECHCFLYDNDEFRGDPYLFKVNSMDDIYLQDNDSNYIVINYNGGLVTYQSTLDMKMLNDSNVLPVFKVFRDGDDIHVLPWKSLGDGLSSRINKMISRTKRFVREVGGGLGISEYGDRNIRITEGRIWKGATRLRIPMYESTEIPIRFFYHENGEWQEIERETYCHSQYDDGTNLKPLDKNTYTVNWVFSGIEEHRSNVFIILGDQYRKFEDAEASKIPYPVPNIINDQTILIGRIITKHKKDTAISIQSNFGLKFSPSGVISDTIKDVDGDTRIEVEADSDDDTIRLIAGGKEVLTIDENGMTVDGKINGVITGDNSSKLINALTGLREDVKINTEYVSPCQLNNVYGKIYRTYFQNELPDYLTHGKNVSQLINYLINFKTDKSRHVTNGITAFGEHRYVNIALLGTSGKDCLNLNASKWHVENGWVDYVK